MGILKKTYIFHHILQKIAGELNIKYLKIKRNALPHMWIDYHKGKSLSHSWWNKNKKDGQIHYLDSFTSDAMNTNKAEI